MTDLCRECKAQLEGRGRYCIRCGADNGEVAKEKCPICESYYNPNAIYCSENGCNIRKYESLRNEHAKDIKGLNHVMFIVLIAWSAILFFSAQFDFSYFYLYASLSTMTFISVGIIWLVGLIRRDINLRKKIEMLGKKS